MGACLLAPLLKLQYIKQARLGQPKGGTCRLRVHPHQQVWKRLPGWIRSRIRAKEELMTIKKTTILVLWAVAFVPCAYAQSFFTDTEPNSTCNTAQLLPSAVLPITVHGFKTQPFGDAVDFFSFSAAPGTRLRVTLNGDISQPNPLTAYGVGFFPSSCPTVPTAQAFTIGSPAQMEYTVPPDGASIIGVTACCDTNFSGSGTIEGAYVLLTCAPNSA